MVSASLDSLIHSTVAGLSEACACSEFGVK